MATEPDLEVKYARNTKVMVGSALLLCILILTIVLFRTYVYLCRRYRRRRNHFSPDPLSTITTIPSKEESLDPSVLKSLPIFTYSSTTSSRKLQDCAVCLSEFSDGDECRTLPNCNHAFHSNCIDKWFASNSNCPLCRTPVRPAAVYSDAEPGDVSVSETGEGCSQFPEPIWSPRKPLGIIAEFPGADSGSGHVPGDKVSKCSLKRLCNV